MNTSRRAAPLAALTILALGLAACGGGDDGSEEEPSEQPTEETPVTVEAPEGFTTDSPVWDTIADLPSENTRTTITADGTHYAYATASGDTLTVVQINLETGEASEEHTEELLTPLDGATPVEDDDEAEEIDTDSSGTDDAPQDFGLVYSGDRLVVAQVGADSAGEEQWSASLFNVGRSGDPTVLTESLDSSGGSGSGAVALPSSRMGPMISVGSRSEKVSYLINAAEADFTEVDGDFTQALDGCGDTSGGCDLLFDPVHQGGMHTVGAFRETSHGGQVGCSDNPQAAPDEDSGFDGCLTGFATDSWASNDSEVAPDGAVDENAFVYAVGDGYAVGAWTTEDGDTVYRPINLDDPSGSHPLVSCEGTLTGSAMHQISRSPTGKYLAAGSLLFDMESGEGECFADTSGGDEPNFVSVDNDGTAWGTTGSKLALDGYAEDVVSATLGDGVQAAGQNVALPLGFVTVDGVEAGIFSVADEASEGERVVAAYPLE